MGESNKAPLEETKAQWFGHPRQLGRLFATEMWERFGFYGMRALLTLYLAQHFLFRDYESSALYGAFTSLVYLTPLIGGVLADQYLGYKRAVKFGAILMALGYFGLCFGGEMARPYMEWNETRYSVRTEYRTELVQAKPVPVARQFVAIDGESYLIYGQVDGSVKLIPSSAGGSERTLAKGLFKFDAERDPFWVNVMFFALACVIVGNGFFKPNISTIVGALYSVGDRRRDAGFTIFYMGINLGSMSAKLLCPLFQERFGFWAGFLLAAIGMFLAWCLFQFDQGRLKGYGEPPVEKSRWSMLIFLGAIASIPLIWLLLNNTLASAEAAASAARSGSGIFGYLLALPILGKILFTLYFSAVVGIPIWSYFAGTREEAEKTVVAVILVVFSVVFWTLFEQAGSSLTLFAKRNTDLQVGSFYQMPAGQVGFFNPFFIVLFAPLVSWLWISLAKFGLEPSIPVKFSIGLVLVGVGFLVLVEGTKHVDNQYRVALWWLVGIYFFHSIGELCLSPVGLSMITKLSMVRIVGLMMGVWFLSSAMAQYVGGMIAQSAATETVAGQVTNPEVALKTYATVYQSMGWWAIGFGFLLLILSPFLRRMMHGVK